MIGTVMSGKLKRGPGLWLSRILLVGLCSTVLVDAAPAKPGTPGPAWFAGAFERVGRSGGKIATLINDRMQVVPQGEGLAFRGCDGQPLALMSFGPAYEIENLLSGNSGDGSTLDCLFNADGRGRPLLTCTAADGAAYTLFALPSGTAGCGG